ncbi:uncharacterized protein CEXT_619811 [Caerostris extrusa]|uniref:Uncharacterized protein n=1 Tax=Caerostris extrusa TaxID=172846 RepID=A0AAV4R827_CAEEX|nr:uncharacterized protein CEXT_619811 [Caerostris extrusa]
MAITLAGRLRSSLRRHLYIHCFSVLFSRRRNGWRFSRLCPGRKGTEIFDTIDHGTFFCRRTGEKEAQIESLAKDFAANKISAAGVSYIVSDRTRLRRALWFISVMACIIIMGYMTVRVIMEYLQYPKVLIKEASFFFFSFY